MIQQGCCYLSLFRPTLENLLLIWPCWLFSAFWPSATEPIQNDLSNRVLAHFEQFAADSVLLLVFCLLARGFDLLARWRRTHPEWHFQKVIYGIQYGMHRTYTWNAYIEYMHGMHAQNTCIEYMHVLENGSMVL